MTELREAWICDYIRTPFGRYGGDLSLVRTDDLGAIPLESLISRNPNLESNRIDEVFLGCANQAGEDNRNVARMSALLAGLPKQVPGTTINRLCGSGMDAIGQAARAIRCGEADLVLAGGVESMSRAPFVMPKVERGFSRDQSIYDTTIGWRFINERMHALYGTDSMPETAENIAQDFNVSRLDQDLYAARSQERTHEAREWLQREITAVTVPQPRKGTKIVTQDEHPRPGTLLEDLARLPAPFRENGTVTAGNASGVNDGAAAVILATEQAAKENGLQCLARISGMASAGVAPRIMGIGPVPATRKLMDHLDLRIDDFDVIEINEAFSAQVLAVIREFGLEDSAEHVNRNGGAISLGHPLGASGARLVGTAARMLSEGGHKRALCTMCIGVGQGIAIALDAA